MPAALPITCPMEENAPMSSLLRSLGLAALITVVCSPLCARAQVGRAYYDAGVFAYEDGDYARAEAQLKKAVSIEPQNPYILHYLGKTYLATGRFTEAAGLLEQAWRIEPRIPELAYDLATGYFKMENYPQAIRFYDAALCEDPSAVLARYYLGISYLKTEQYQQALDHLLLAADRSPTIRDNGYYFAGVCYQRLDRLEKAVEKFTYVMDNAASSSLRENARHCLAAVNRQRRSIKRYSLYFQTGYINDSNVLLEAVGQDLPSGKRDSAVFGYFSGSYDFLKTGTWTLGAGYSHYHLDYQRHDEFDLGASLPRIYLRKRFEPVVFSLTYTPQYYWLGNDDYLKKHEIRPDLLWRITSSLDARLAYAHEVKDYFDAIDLSGHADKVDADLFFTLPGNRLQLHGGGGHEVNSADVSAQDYRRTQLRLGAMACLPWALRLHVTGKYTFKDYPNPNPALGHLKREDETLEALANLSRGIFYDWLQITAEYRYTRNDSNIRYNDVDIFDYDRHQVTVSLTASF